MIDKTGITGQDTLMITKYKNKLYYFFGDTECIQDPRQNNCNNYGMYSVGATSCVPSLNKINDSFQCSGDNPPNLTYFSIFNNNQSIWYPQPMAPVLPMSDNSWISAATTVIYQNKTESLYIYCVKPNTNTNLWLKWNDNINQFETINQWPNNQTIYSTMNRAVNVLKPGFFYLLFVCVKCHTAECCDNLKQPKTKIKIKIKKQRI